MSIPTPDYRNTLFLNPELERIHGKPDFVTLYKLVLDLRANAQSVPTNLGGGSHGHLGLLMTPEQYAQESDIPYIRPAFPAPLVIAQNMTRIQENNAVREHKEELRLFHEANSVEKALIQQLVTAIGNAYLLPFKNRATGQFNGNLTDILQYLFTTHGKVSPAKLMTLDQEISEMSYEPTHPIEEIFSKLEDLKMYGTYANLPYTSAQIIAKAYNIINRTGTIFKHYITTWNRKPAENKTWANFKQHFRTAHEELEETGDLTLQDTGFHQANLVTELTEKITNELLHRANIVSHEETTFPNTVPETPTALAAATSSSPDANSIIEKLLAQNQALMEQLASNQNSNTRNNRRGVPSLAPREGTPIVPLPHWANKYCWTHGKCGHTSNKCRNKAPNHKDDATMSNKMNGSTYGCDEST